jgi:glycosyltransferase involved in cell wall biosynthesis
VTSLRIYGNLRSSHLERFAEFSQADVVYHGQREDLELDLAPHNLSIRKLSRLRILTLLARGAYSTVEINEPLMIRLWPDLVPQVMIAKFGRRIRRRRVEIVAHCIENLDPRSLLKSKHGLVGSLGAFAVRPIGRALVTSCARLAFWTTGAYETYERVVGPAALSPRARIYESVPSQCSCLRTARATEVVDADAVLFLGRLDERKGVMQLIAAWDDISRENPRTTLSIIGDGPLLEAVLHFAAARREVSVHTDLPRTDIHRALRLSRTVVLLSQPVSYWREQLGLPIIEGLSHGCTVVATDQTGLARWLVQNGHPVVPTTATSHDTAAAVCASLVGPAQKQRNLCKLPLDDPRIVADHWLLEA